MEISTVTTSSHLVDHDEDSDSQSSVKGLENNRVDILEFYSEISDALNHIINLFIQSLEDTEKTTDGKTLDHSAKTVKLEDKHVFKQKGNKMQHDLTMKY